MFAVSSSDTLSSSQVAGCYQVILHAHARGIGPAAESATHLSPQPHSPSPTADMRLSAAAPAARHTRQSTACARTASARMAVSAVLSSGVLVMRAVAPGAMHSPYLRTAHSRTRTYSYSGEYLEAFNYDGELGLHRWWIPEGAQLSRRWKQQMAEARGIASWPQPCHFPALMPLS